MHSLYYQRIYTGIDSLRQDRDAHNGYLREKNLRISEKMF